MKAGVLVVIVVVLLICLVALIAGLLLVRSRTVQASERLLVRINAPVDGAEVWIDRVQPVVITVDNANSVARLELWENGQLYEARDADQEGLTVYSAIFTWRPARAGVSTLVARAVDAQGNTGQATVVVQAVEEVPAGEPDVPPPLEGPGPPGHAVEPSGEEALPGEVEGPSGEDEPPSQDEAPPGGEGGGPVVEWPQAGGFVAEPVDPDPDGPADEVLDLGLLGQGGGQATLTAEVVGLDAGLEYHVVNCYVIAADEAEQVLFEKAGGDWILSWKPTETFSATFPWPAGETLPLTAICVGISPPAAAEELGGAAQGEAPPETWDGRHLRLESPGGFALLYRVTVGSAVTSESLPAPTNLRVEDERFSSLQKLCWDWAAAEGAEADGFRLYLDGSLQWRVADPDARCTYLPPEWLEPPCGQSYRFQVTAYQGALSTGVESPPGEMAPLSPDPDRCGDVYRLTFERIEFLDIPPGVPDADGAAGPLYGWFTVQGVVLPFDTVQSDGSSVAGVWVAGGESYDLADTLFAAPYRYHQNSIVFQWDNLQPMLQLSVIVMDYDWAEGDAEDDVLCGMQFVGGGPPEPGLDTLRCTSTLGGDLVDVARVTYSIARLEEWPEGGPPSGAVRGVPRPDLLVSQWWLPRLVDSNLAVGVANEGTAAVVPDVDVLIEVGGEAIGAGTYTIPPGDPEEHGWDGYLGYLDVPGLTLSSYAELCDMQITVDPLDRVLEYDEGNNVLTAADLDKLRSRYVIAGQDARSACVEVWTEYFSCHGDPIEVRAIPLIDGEEAPGFVGPAEGAVTCELPWQQALVPGEEPPSDHVTPAYPALAEHDLMMSIESRPVWVGVLYTGADAVTTNGWRFQMVEVGTGEVFYSRDLEGGREWIP